MKAQFKKAALSEAIQVVSMVIPARSTLPILQSIKLVCENKESFIVGTDMEIGIRYFLADCTVSEEGQMVLPAQRLGNLLRELPDEQVTIESDGLIGNLQAADGYFKLLGSEPADFPDFPAFDEKKHIRVQTKDLREMIRRTVFATAQEVSRYALTGVLFSVTETDLRLVASDGRRMAYTKTKMDRKGETQARVIIPPKALSLLERVIGGDETLKVNIDESQIKFKTENALIFSRLVEGNYPDYEAAIPEDCDKKVKLQVDAFHAMLRRAAVLTSEKSRAVKMLLNKGKLTLFTRTQDVGEAKIELAVDYRGDNFEMVFNPEFFNDALRIVAEKEVLLEMRDKTSACLLRFGKDYLYLVMPLSVDI
jgi:DNA polymerase-3 subunit beta